MFGFEIIDAGLLPAMLVALLGGVLSFLSPWMLGLIVVGPWLGHASWHAYRGAVTWSQEG